MPGGTEGGCVCGRCACGGGFSSGMVSDEGCVSPSISSSSVIVMWKLAAHSTVNVADFNILASHYNQVLTPSSPFNGIGAAPGGGTFSGTIINGGGSSESTDNLDSLVD